MSRQTTLSDVAAQRTLTECADTTKRDNTPTTERALLDRTKAHAADVAAEHFPDLPIEAIAWEVSHRRQRSAGATKYDPSNGEITISLAWDAYDSQGWEQFSSTVRHELIHAWQFHEFGEADHGRTFDRWTDALDTTQYCKRFKTPTWWIVCEDCDGQLPRYRRSKVVKQPENYSCGNCGGSLRIEEAASE
ncbi:SprT family zinc-dependent metalloprotease [Haladaptatus halobius]|uniref:SprT family zinc-dependent metalloprotease n=1 Tax=Haladaptatus halobius TaxID=2884875 RepID=UPI001D0B6DB2|nr:SprT-like domain-containing protein [Haladaptatus halobius]